MDLQTWVILLSVCPIILFHAGLEFSGASDQSHTHTHHRVVKTHPEQVCKDTTPHSADHSSHFCRLLHMIPNDEASVVPMRGMQQMLALICISCSKATCIPSPHIFYTESVLICKPDLQRHSGKKKKNIHLELTEGPMNLHLLHFLCRFW